MARVIKGFDGVCDGQVRPRRFVAGDQVYGDLARVAIAEGWASEDMAPETAAAKAAPARKGKGKDVK